MKKYRILGNGIGKTYTKFGKWIIDNKLNQQWISDHTGLNRHHLSRLSTDINFEPNFKLMSSVISELKRLHLNVTAEMFWPNISKFSIWLIDNEISQEKLSEITRINERTIKHIREVHDLSDLGYLTHRSIQQMISSLEIHGYKIIPEDLWEDFQNNFKEEKQVNLTPLGQWLESHEFGYGEFARMCDASITTIRYLCEDSSQSPSGTTMVRIITVIKRYDPDKRINDFWDI